jgi:hypothetical protein
MLLKFQTAVGLSLLLVGLWISPASGAVHVKGLLSTGQAFDGQLLKDDGPRLTVKEKKRKSTLWTVNIVECTVGVAGEKLPADVDGLPGSGLGKFMLTKGHKFLAEVTFLCALSKTARSNKTDELTLPLWSMEKTSWEKLIEGEHVSSIKAMYKKTRQTLPVRLGGKKSRKWRPRRYQLPRPDAIASVMKKADEWGKKMYGVASKTHRIETPHFVIYSAWRKGDDARLKGIYEKLYAGLCKQFDVPATENIWIGKLPVYAFWEKMDFVSFSVAACKIPLATAQQAGGFAGRHGFYQYVCLGPVMMKGMRKSDAKTWFYELLVHESTHAFLVRYINSHHLVNWLNEGIAEMLAATFVPKGGTSRKLQAAHAMVKRGEGAKFLPMLTARNIPLESAAYGAAQSLARFLVFRGKSKFIELVYELKRGTGSEEALKKVYGMTHKGLLQQWAKKIR